MLTSRLERSFMAKTIRRKGLIVACVGNLPGTWMDVDTCISAPICCWEKLSRRRRGRRSFSFLRREKKVLNRIYRGLVNKWLRGRYLLADYFFITGAVR